MITKNGEKLLRQIHKAYKERIKIGTPSSQAAEFCTDDDDYKAFDSELLEYIYELQEADLIEVDIVDNITLLPNGIHLIEKIKKDNSEKLLNLAMNLKP